MVNLLQIASICMDTCFYFYGFEKRELILKFTLSLYQGVNPTVFL